jgi:hypothetical protein
MVHPHIKERFALFHYELLHQFEKESDLSHFSMVD